MTALVRSAALTHFAELAAACGLDPRALVAGVGLQPRCLTDPDLKIPAHRVGRLLETAAAQGREPAFGLRLAESRRLSNLGPLALLVRDEPTLRRALEALMLHIHVHNEAVAVHVAEHAGLVVIRTELSADGGGSLRQATELVVGVTFRVLQVFMGAAWRPRLVCFTHSAPPSLAAHRRVLGPAVEFGHEFNGIVCNAADLDAPNPGADPVLARYSRKLLAPTLARWSCCCCRAGCAASRWSRSTSASTAAPCTASWPPKAPPSAHSSTARGANWRRATSKAPTGR